MAQTTATPTSKICHFFLLTKIYY